MKPKSQKLDLEAAARLVQPRDSLLCGFVAGQPVGFLEALGARTDLEDVALYTGLLTQPFALLKNPGVRVVSGFFGPIERMARAAGARVSYLPADFNGLERRALRMKPRVALAVTSPPDREGWLSFGVQAGASYRPFLQAARDPARLAIAEVNPRMPRIDGVPELGGNRVHLSEVDAWVEHETELVTLPEEPPSPEELAIARRVCDLIQPEAIPHFVSGAAAAPEGRSFLCLKSTAKVGGTRVSTIVAAFSEGTRVTTPRHHVQWVVTEHGAVDLSVLSDAERPRALIELAHPDFRESLRTAAWPLGGIQ